MHSATKFIGGHSDLLLGAAVCRDEAHAGVLATYRHDHGVHPRRTRGRSSRCAACARSPSGSTGPRRRPRSSRAGSTRTRTCPRVHYPGLPGDSAARAGGAGAAATAAGPMLSFEVAGTVEQTEAFLARLRLFAHATSLGGVESLIERRARYAGDAAVVGPHALPCCRSASRTSRTSGPTSTLRSGPPSPELTRGGTGVLHLVHLQARHLRRRVPSAGRGHRGRRQRHGGLPGVGDVVVEGRDGLQRRLLLGGPRSASRTSPRRSPHKEAKASYDRWYDGYQVVVAEIRTAYGDGRLDHITSPIANIRRPAGGAPG